MDRFHLAAQLFQAVEYSRFVEAVLAPGLDDHFDRAAPFHLLVDIAGGLAQRLVGVQPLERHVGEAHLQHTREADQEDDRADRDNRTVTGDREVGHGQQEAIHALMACRGTLRDGALERHHCEQCRQQHQAVKQRDQHTGRGEEAEIGYGSHRRAGE